MRAGMWSGVTLFPTFVCNYSCPFCCFSADLNQHRADELTLAEIETLARGLGRVLVLHIGGGEPFVRADLPEVVAAMSRGTGVMKVEIPTNGWNAERIAKPVRRILELVPGVRLNVRVSLDGVGARHDELRAHKGAWDGAVGTLKALRALSEEFPTLSTGVCQTVTAHNQGEALETYRTVRDTLKPDSVVLNVCREGSQEDRAALDVLPESYGAVIREMNADVETGAFWNYPRIPWLRSAFLNGLHATVWDLISEELSSKRPKLRCAAGAGRSLVVYATGDVAFCELDKPVGNLREHGGSIEALLASARAREGRAALSACEKRHEVCWHTAAPDPRLNPLLALRVVGRAARLAAARALRPRGGAST